MRWSNDALQSPTACLRLFLENQMEELRRAGEFLDPAELQDFLNYYGRHVQNPLAGAALETEVRGGVRSTYGHVLGRILAGRPDRPFRVLDAGCGFGTECLLFASAGADVTGNDLRGERVHAAEKRPAFWARETGRPLALRFRLANIFDEPERDHFDVIWVHNAITHIHPVDGFLRLCRDLLAPGGEVVIVDVNKTSLRRRLQGEHEKHQGASQYTTRIDPATGKEVVYAVERDFGLLEQCRLLEQAGLRVSHRECYLGGHAGAGEFAWNTFLRPLDRSILAAWLGSRYVVAGMKE
jgi:2-polyprenyl-3-methyl-5-hydroxy-6-metoxy-1,4-benzoquinol methylase